MSHKYRRALVHMTTAHTEVFGRVTVRMYVAQREVTYVCRAPGGVVRRFFWQRPIEADELAPRDETQDYHAVIADVLAWVLAHEHDAGTVKRCAHCRTVIDGGAQGRKRFCSLWCKDEYALAQAKHRRVG